MKENKIVLFTKYLLNFMFCTGILAVASLPYTLKTGRKILFSRAGDHYISMLIIFFVSGICGLVIVYQLRKMIGTVIRRNCFSDVNTKSLKIMGGSGISDYSSVFYKTIRDSHTGNIYYCAYFLYCRTIQPCTEPGLLRSDKV